MLVGAPEEREGGGGKKEEVKEWKSIRV